MKIEGQMDRLAGMPDAIQAAGPGSVAGPAEEAAEVEMAIAGWNRPRMMPVGKIGMSSLIAPPCIRPPTCSCRICEMAPVP